MTPNGGDPADPSLSWARTLREAADAVEKLDARIRADWSTVPDERVQLACGDVGLVAEFVYRCLRKTEVAEVVSAAVRKDKTYVEAFARIHSTIDDFGACMVAIDRVGSPDEERSGSVDHLVDRLTGLASTLRQDLEKAVDTFVAVVERTAGDPGHAKARANALLVAKDASRQLKARKLFEQTERALVKRVRADQRKAAGNAALKELGRYYADHGENETKRADLLRVVVAGLLVLIAGAGIVINLLGDAASVAAELLRLSVTIPIAVLAGYLARESSKHRLSAKWAHELAIEMRSLPDYADSLGDTGEELRRAFGMRVFGTGVERTAPSTEDGLFHEVTESVRRLLEVIESRGKSQ
ncbi:hypothetical protein ALI22I_28750 [Saccharothrix sp. ALI-22-I]|uniref:hypothetical protein n=1 Tax=Saccharothrix sp. ALI-22-I TaxID=1933778 RepID=UPI00097CA9D6|nr:hypothetical protein [Saccharothrix sp. ALI-22-I]ONI84546.1 hypothetical protein ALI22I_28750 [Saccharothrix sp. ALI-22-I]